MYLRCHRRNKKSTDYDYWSLVECVRTASGHRQRIVATLGKLPGADTETRVGWEHISELLDGRIHQGRLFCTEPDPSGWVRVDISRASVEQRM